MEVTLSGSVKVRFGALGASLLVLGALVAMATGVTGAYFSDSKEGEIKGTTGSIRVHTSGGTGSNGLNFNFKYLLPGEPQTATVEYKNIGHNPQDVWVVFDTPKRCTRSTTSATTAKSRWPTAAAACSIPPT